MSRAKIVLNDAGIKAVLKSSGVDDECRRIAEGMYQQVSSVEGYKLEPRRYPERVGYAIYADEFPAIQDNLSNNTLVRIGKV